jgi:hypothetical protein
MTNKQLQSYKNTIVSNVQYAVMIESKPYGVLVNQVL